MLKQATQTMLLASFLGLGLNACQAGEDNPGQVSGSAQTTIPSATVQEKQVEHSTEAVVGPDEAFFAAAYLEQLFRFSKDNVKPELSLGFALSGEQERVSAFEFDANFSDSRLQLMTHTLLALGDSDHDQLLSEQEFLALRLKPEILGSGGESLAHTYSRDLYVQLAAGSAGLGSEEIKGLLRGLGPSLKRQAFIKGDKEQRLLLIRAWDKVLKSYDKDQDGTISSAEQRALRQERSGILARLQG